MYIKYLMPVIFQLISMNLFSDFILNIRTNSQRKLNKRFTLTIEDVYDISNKRLDHIKRELRYWKNIFTNFLSYKKNFL